MHILIVAATESEVADLKPRLERNADLLITGVGMVATAVRCARLLAQDNFDLVLNVGLCGSFDPGLKPGTVVHVARDRIAELGAEDGDTFLTMTELKLPAECKELQVVSGVTVNTAHGNERSIAALVERYAPQVESMEGAAFMSACLVSGVRFAQVRAVSNIVERRNRSAWRIPDALAALTRSTLRILEGL